MNFITRFFHRLLAADYFYRWSGRLIPWLGGISAILLAIGLIDGLFFAPTDYEQGEGYRIIFVHVPSAWMSLFVYVLMAGAGLVALVWRVKLAELIAMQSAPIGASFTAAALITGSLWGKPMWGSFWVWDARLTSELILLFLYLGVIGLYSAIEDRRNAARAAALLALVGVINVPIIHFSVEWWHSLHQGPTVSRFDAPAIHPRMLTPLLLVALGSMTYYAAALLMRVRAALLRQERKRPWVQALAEET